jgi:hypothetical protein
VSLTPVGGAVTGEALQEPGNRAPCRRAEAGNFGDEEVYLDAMGALGREATIDLDSERT